MRIFFLLTLALLLGPIAAAKAQTAVPERLPDDAKRLQTAEIKALLGSTPFQFVGAGGKARGTSTWDLATGTAHGSFVWEGRLRGAWTLAWSVRDDLSCLEPARGEPFCLEIYAYEDGFLEVNPDGSIHTLTTPLELPPLANALTAEEARALYPPFIAWAQRLQRSVESASKRDGLILLEVVGEKGTSQALSIDAETGAILGAHATPR